MSPLRRLAVALLPLLAVTAGIASDASGAGWPALLSGRHDEAREAFLAALERNPGDLESALGLAALLEARAEPQAAEEVLASALARDARGELAMGALARLATLIRRTPDGGAAAEPVLARIADGTIPSDLPEVRMAARVARAEARANRGEAREALASFVVDAGRITRWTVLAPFGRLSRRDLRIAFPPERCELGTEGLPAGPSGLAPRRVDLVVGDGQLEVPVPLAGIGIAYAVTDFEAHRRVELPLRIQAPVSWRAFVDGTEVASNDVVADRPPLARTVRLVLPRGRHRLLVKLANDEGAYTVTADLGPALAAGDVSLVEPAGCPRAEVAAQPADPDFEQGDAEPPTSPALVLARKWWLRARNLDRESGRVLAQLVERWPDAPLLLYLRGEHLKNAATGADAAADLTAARADLERALDAAPDLVRAALLIAEIDEGAERYDQAWERTGVVLAVDPDDPEALMLRHRILQRRGFPLEADRLLSRARERAPGWTSLLAAHRDLLASLGAASRQAAAEDELARRNPLAAFPAFRALAAGRPDEAARLLAERTALRPTQYALQLGRITALIEAGRRGEALAALDDAERIFPGAAQLAVHRAALLAAGGADEREVDRLLEEVLHRDPSRTALWRTLELRSGRSPLRRWLVDVGDLLRSGDPPPRDVDAALLADVAVVWIDRFGGQTELYQGVHQVYTRDGVEQEAELQLQPGARLERVTIHKPDGRTIDVRMPDRPPYSLPGLEPGDAFSYTWWLYVAPLPSLPGALDSRSVFLFQGPDRDYRLSRYVILHEPDVTPTICGNLDGLEIDEREEDGIVIHSYTARENPRKPLEPHVPDRMEIVPHVRLTMGMSWADLGEVMRGRLEGLVLADPPLPELAARVRQRAGEGADAETLARSLHEVVRESVAPGATSLDFAEPASASASAGEGNRTLVALALARLVGLEATLVLTRPVELAGRLLECPMPGMFGYPLVEVSAGDRRWYLDYNDADHPFDEIPVRFGGSDAQRIPLDPRRPVEIARLPWRDPGVLEQLVADLELSANGTVSGTVTLTARGALASVLRRMLRELPEDRRPLAYESIAGQSYPGARVLDSAIEGLDDPAAPLVIRVRFEGGALAGPRPTGLALPLVTGRLPLLEEYASLPSRTQPLLFDLQSFRRDTVTVRLPPGVEVLDTPDPVTIDGPFGRYALEAVIRDGSVRIVREAALPPRRIEIDDYARFRDFARRVADAERAELLLAVTTPSLDSSGAR
ncbi:MAG: tetratricopeptide repeat protein [Acidobacteria bacterium]|nr:MAG: tetratricopeptide repeat protein [Acidobacteriota bacterium]